MGEEMGVGGLVGSNSGTVSNSYSTCSVTGWGYLGGLVGWNMGGTVSSSHATGMVTAEWYGGGLVGSNGGTVSDSYSSGNVSGQSNVGGLVGGNSGSLTNSYATGTVTRSSGTEEALGGFVGTNWQGEIINCYSIGSVHYEGAEDPTDKGFAGSVDLGGDYQMAGNFWDIQTSGQSSTAGDATGKTTAEMQDVSTFSGATWDITAVAPGVTFPAHTWNIVDGQSYPFLGWELDRGAPVVSSITETVTDDTLDAKAEADTEVLVTGNATVTVALFADNPGGDAPAGFGSLGKYIDVYVPNTDDVDEIEIRLYYTADELAGADLNEESLRLMWWDGWAWADCSDSGVNTDDTNGYSGYIWARITADSSPSLAQLAGTPFGGYSAAEIIEIHDWYDLDAIRDNLSGSFILMNDLDSSSAGYLDLAGPTANEGKGWQPIGTEQDPFTGSFDGQAYEIRDLFINRPDQDYVGLLGYAWWGAVIEDVVLADVQVTGGAGTGGLAGYSLGTVSSSHCSGSVTGSSSVGGLIGVNHWSLANAGFVGSVTGDANIGGLTGVNGASSTVSRCYSSGSVVGKSYVGGLVGTHYGTVSESYSTGDVVGWDSVGGIVGHNFGIVNDSYSTGSVTRSEHAGGWLGGFVGHIVSGTITNCYSTGSVSFANAADPTDKGFAGSVDTGGGYQMTGNFWDTDTSGQTSTAGEVVGKTTGEMMSITTFENEGWDITAVAPGQADHSCIWNIVDGQSYPFLPWELAPFLAVHLLLTAGWNMVSLPLHTLETSPAVLFPGHVAIYTWNANELRYEVPAELVPGQGYWVLYFDDASVEIHGTPVDQYELVDAVAGWHMIGSVAVEAPVTVIEGNVYSPFYWWNPDILSYEATDTIEPRKGYWLLGLTPFSIVVAPQPPLQP
jgi:hypothetical protein